MLVKWDTGDSNNCEYNIMDGGSRGQPHAGDSY